MKRQIKFIRLVGGKDDGQLTKLKTPWEADPAIILKISSGDHFYKLLRVENETAFFEVLPQTVSEAGLN